MCLCVVGVGGEDDKFFGVVVVDGCLCVECFVVGVVFEFCGECLEYGYDVLFGVGEVCVFWFEVVDGVFDVVDGGDLVYWLFVFLVYVLLSLLVLCGIEVELLMGGCSSWGWFKLCGICCCGVCRCCFLFLVC